MRFSIWGRTYQTWADLLDIARYADAGPWRAFYAADHFMSATDTSQERTDFLEATAIFAGLAATTSRIRLAPLVLSMTYRHPAVVANTILGRLGLMGRLGDAVRDRQGLAYYVSSDLQPGRGEHPWYVYAGVNLDNLDRAVRSIHIEVAHMREELVTPEELRDCQTYLVGALPLHLESSQITSGDAPHGL